MSNFLFASDVSTLWSDAYRTRCCRTLLTWHGYARSHGVCPVCGVASDSTFVNADKIGVRRVETVIKVPRFFGLWNQKLVRSNLEIKEA